MMAVRCAFAHAVIAGWINLFRSRRKYGLPGGHRAAFSQVRIGPARGMVVVSKHDDRGHDEGLWATVWRARLRTGAEFPNAGARGSGWAARVEDLRPPRARSDNGGPTGARIFRERKCRPLELPSTGKVVGEGAEQVGDGGRQVGGQIRPADDSPKVSMDCVPPGSPGQLLRRRRGTGAPRPGP